MQSKEYKLIYITGYGRSGSTILDLILGDSEHIVGLGELNNLMTSGWVNNEYCSCGQPANQCTFWDSVKSKWQSSASIPIDEYIRLQTKFIGTRKIPLLLWQGIKKSSDFKVLEAETKNLYNSIAEVSKAEVLVDSSKFPYRLLALKIMGFQPLVIHLVRDGRAVLNSVKKAFKSDLKSGVQHDLKPKPTLRTAISWSLYNRLAEWFTKDTSKLFIRYEDLIADPLAKLEDIENTFHVDLSRSKKDLMENNPLKKGHTIAGNRLRMQSEVRVNLKPDESWRDKLGNSDIKKFESVAGGLLKKYGYK